MSKAARSKKAAESRILGTIFKKIAPLIGATVLMEPEWNIVGQITFQNGRRRYFRYSSMDLNSLGASDVAKDKAYAAFFMEKMGYPVPVGQTFFSKRWASAIGSKRDIDAAFRYASKIGFPVIVKPNSGSQGGDVALVHTKQEFYRAMRTVFKSDRVALVQRPVVGDDYRIVVLDDSVISAYQRVPLHVVGDGRKSIRRLLQDKEKSFIASKRDTRIRWDDRRMSLKLKRQKMTFKTVPAPGEKVFLLDNANLSTGGDSLDVTDILHPSVKKMAVQLTKDMGLRLCGVDLLTEGDIRKPLGKHTILEINAAPGLDHYARSGKQQEKIVEELYLEVLRSMEHAQ